MRPDKLPDKCQTGQHLAWTEPKDSAKPTGALEGSAEQAGLGWVSLDHSLLARTKVGLAGQHRGQFPTRLCLAEGGDDYNLDLPHRSGQPHLGGQVREIPS